jgi:hypothetical protein
MNFETKHTQSYSLPIAALSYFNLFTLTVTFLGGNGVCTQFDFLQTPLFIVVVPTSKKKHFA